MLPHFVESCYTERIVPYISYLVLSMSISYLSICYGVNYLLKQRQSIFREKQSPTHFTVSTNIGIIYFTELEKLISTGFL